MAGAVAVARQPRWGAEFSRGLQQLGREGDVGVPVGHDHQPGRQRPENRYQGN